MAARVSLQRQSNVLENVLALARSLPTDLAEKMREALNSYAREVALAASAEGGPPAAKSAATRR